MNHRGKQQCAASFGIWCVGKRPMGVNEEATWLRKREARRVAGRGGKALWGGEMQEKRGPCFAEALGNVWKKKHWRRWQISAVSQKGLSAKSYIAPIIETVLKTLREYVEYAFMKPLSIALFITTDWLWWKGMLAMSIWGFENITFLPIFPCAFDSWLRWWCHSEGVHVFMCISPEVSGCFSIVNISFNG